MSEYVMLNGISYAYPGSSVPVFEDLSVSFTSGWTVVAGANGAGKSTLARIISGFIVPDHGTVSASGDVLFCPQVFAGLDSEDYCYIYDGSSDTGRLRSLLGLTDDMIAEPDHLSGGEKKRLQILAAVSRHPSVLILDEPTNHLDRESAGMVSEVLSAFSGCGIMITHDRAAAEMLSSRTLFLERMMEMPARIYDVPLPLAAAVDEIERRKRDGRSAYERLSSEIASLSALFSNLSEQSAAKRKKLSKSGLDIHDHSGKAAVDGARLTGKDRSLDDQRRRVDSQARHKREMIEQMEKPLMRKTGIDLDAGGYIPSLSFPAAVLDAGGYSLHVPSLSIPPGEHIGITGCNGSGKTLLVRALVSKFISEGKGSHIIYIPQEYDRGQADAIISRFSSLSDCDRGRVVSDIYRMGSDPSFLLSADISPSPGELKKLDFILSRYDGRNIIVMDEPTNHLDIVSAGIFEKMLAKEDTSFSLLLVSHDEMFIRRTCSIRWAVVREGSSGKVLAASSIQ